MTTSELLYGRFKAGRLGLLSELCPNPPVSSLGFWSARTNDNAETQLEDIAQGGLTLSEPMTVPGGSATSARIKAAVETFARRQAGDAAGGCRPYFYSQRETIVALAARYHLPAIYEWREFAQAGGLASYGTNNLDDYRLAGIYVGRVLKGENPADLPVMRATKFEFVINLRTASALGIDVAPMLSARADEVIE